MAYSYWDKKSIFHSDLRRSTEDNAGISFMITSDLRLSKNKTDQIVLLQPYGDEKSYWYQCENERVAATIASMPRDTWLICKAHGDRDNAYLEFTDVDGKPLTSLDQAVEAVAPTQPAPPSTATPAQLPHQPTGIAPPQPGYPSEHPVAKDIAPPSTPPQPAAPVSTPPNEPQVPANIPQVQDKQDRIDGLMFDCLLRADAIVGRFQDLHGRPPTDLTQRLGVTLFINDH